MSERIDDVLDRYLIAEFDELNRLSSGTYTEEDISLTDEVRNYLEDMYIEGFSSAFYLLGVDVGTIDKALMLAAIYALVDGKSFSDRLDGELSEWEIWRIARSEGHRVFVTGQEDGARQASKIYDMLTYKVWCSKLDSRVRNTHIELEGDTQPLDGWFVTPNGRAQKPGAFGVPEEDVNCRCVLNFISY